MIISLGLSKIQTAQGNGVVLFINEKGDETLSDCVR